MSRLRRASGDVVRVPAGELEVHAPVARPVPVCGGDGAQVPQVVVLQMPPQEGSRAVDDPSVAMRWVALLMACAVALGIGVWAAHGPPVLKGPDDRPVVQQERGR